MINLSNLSICLSISTLHSLLNSQTKKAGGPRRFPGSTRPRSSFIVPEQQPDRQGGRIPEKQGQKAAYFFFSLSAFLCVLLKRKITIWRSLYHWLLEFALTHFLKRSLDPRSTVRHLALTVASPHMGLLTGTITTSLPYVHMMSSGGSPSSSA